MNQGKVILVTIGIIILAVIVIYGIPFENSMTTETVETNPYAWVTEYTTPNDDIIKAKTQEILGSSYDGELSVQDLYDLQDWVGKNIHYTVQDPEYPSQTLLDMNGDCYSMSSLLYSMILHESNKDSCSYILLVDIKEENSPNIMKHSSVMTVFDNGIVISDTTLGSYTNTYCKLKSPEDAINRIIDGTTVQWYTVTEAINLNTYQEFSNYEDFYSYAESKMNSC